MLQTLPGRIGRQDVCDCLAALDAAIAHGMADASRVAVVGGSHGGFLGAHLIGQAPTRFVSACFLFSSLEFFKSGSFILLLLLQLHHFR